MIFFLCGALIGFFGEKLVGSISKKRPTHIEIRETGYDLISPLIECENLSNAEENTELDMFKSKIEDVVEKLFDNDKSVKSISLYFRELNDGPWFAVGETEKFAPASLLKVPVMMAILKASENDSKFLEKRLHVEFGSDSNAGSHNMPKMPLRAGDSYTVEELLYYMIVHSDNNATEILDGLVDPSVLRKTFSIMGVEYPYLSGRNDYSMTVQAYASFFRVLYNASFLDTDMSIKALKLLLESEYKDGLAAGVPSNVKVAHKFGERSVGDTGVEQLHDCGIVYYPKRPYLLCVMTRGTRFDVLDDVIRKISQSVYLEVDNQRSGSQ